MTRTFLVWVLLVETVASAAKTTRPRYVPPGRQHARHDALVARRFSAHRWRKLRREWPQGVKTLVAMLWSPDAPRPVRVAAAELLRRKSLSVAGLEELRLVAGFESLIRIGEEGSDAEKARDQTAAILRVCQKLPPLQRLGSAAWTRERPERFAIIW